MKQSDQPHGTNRPELLPEDFGSPEIPSIPDHRLFGPIASGAYGEVWLGANAVGTLRAIKIVRRDQHASVESFQREFKGLQKFEPVSRSHEGFVDILTIGLLPGSTGFYYVMELADDVAPRTGMNADPSSPIPTPLPQTYRPRTLRSDLQARGCGLPAEDVITLGLKLAAGLACLHGDGLVHRDVKPSNILFIGGEPKLADAGLVAAVEDARSLVGTAGYIAPEGPGTPQADIYALGKVLYEAAFGKDRQQFPELPVDVASCPDHTQLLEINEIIAKACAHDPKRRYASADLMHAELQLLASRKSVRRRRAQQELWSISKKTGIGVALVVLLVTIALRVAPGGADQYMLSLNAEVNECVDQGFDAWREGTPERLRYAAEKFEKALQKEPNYVPALYGLGIVYLYDLTKLREIRDKLKKIAPGSAEAWGNMAYLEWHEGHFREGLAHMKLATEKVPACREGHAWAYGGYGYFLQNMGDAEGARKQYREAERITGIDPIILDHFGHTYFMRSNWVEALSYHQKAIDFKPGHPNGYYWKARTLEAMGRFNEAMDADEQRDRKNEKDPAEIKRIYDGLRTALAQNGPEGYWRKRLANELENSPPDLYLIATLHIRLGDKDQAYECLEKAFKQNPFAGGLMVDPCWDRTDKRFKAFARKVGLMQ
jgi:tetratricopeptide (TPR) repeat protein